MNNSSSIRWTLFFILLIALGLFAYKVLKSLPSTRIARLYRKMPYNKLNKPSPRNANDVSYISRYYKIMKPTTVIVPKTQPKPVIRKSKLKWKRGIIFYREINPISAPKLHILLLHGKMFTSANWAKLNTMNILAARGYRVVAMDLPGQGKSTYKFQVHSNDKNRAKFLANFMREVGLVSPVIVSPSSSGRYSIPYITALKNSAKEVLNGFVSIAAVGTDRVPGKEYKNFPTTLIVRGSKDTSLGETSSSTLRLNIPHSVVKVIQGAGHACYMDKPGEFHAILLKFLKDIFSHGI
ncbi:protein ABHD14A-like [Dendronephthya gigantea]|uniref:protein ABHD14A-like n=1 Tax=Dendronephthya gigantea TaxID=151771 RepID=UPI00106C233E|nr:protein ABHD14A-like [Dendronephthya gigantea]